MDVSTRGFKRLSTDGTTCLLALRPSVLLTVRCVPCFMSRFGCSNAFISTWRSGTIAGGGRRKSPRGSPRRGSPRGRRDHRAAPARGSSPRRGSRSPEIDFKNGRCDRGKDCKFKHVRSDRPRSPSPKGYKPRSQSPISTESGICYYCCFLLPRRELISIQARLTG